MNSSQHMGDDRSVPEFQSPPRSRAKSLVFLTNAAGAAVSLALIGGIAMWSYKLVMRDVTGIPVVRAMAGEMRVRPEDPGGMQARHQGLAVNAVAAEGEAEAPADRIVLAPRPAALTDEDQPITPQAVAAVQQPDAPEKTAADEAKETTVADISESLAAGNVDGLVAQLTDGVAPIDAEEATENAEVAEEADDGTVALAEIGVETATEGTPTELAEVMDEDETSDAGTEMAILAALAGIQQEDAQAATPAIARSVPGVRTSIRPRTRPEDGPEMLIRASLSAPAPTPAAASNEIDATKIPTGTRLAQLGAFDSVEVARSEWARLETRFGDYLHGKSRVIEKASSGGRTFYRLRAMGFTDLADARRFCSTLVAENADCIPVVTR
ncbi:SPOR domain-containing protein [Sulfitobacter sp. D35]|uniref:SPOR domain-containing protein n=1 Tax=Sulfitobacter sp. D35 TaxID=3083252 RepID=UPI00296E5450|nr:SPOR domain-containing protein [Sulfitobacter sp. D35]MDW4497577.1 SPOR domain-containing protein [Sulfitobacter sp. D35]